MSECLAIFVRVNESLLSHVTSPEVANFSMQDNFIDNVYIVMTAKPT